jgi:uncharacterized membrane-anchored protein YjiN (DUF445 family)
METDGRVQALRRMKALATALLVVAAIVFLIARSFHDDPAVWGYVEAGAEAAMVGALADWFAVTALFRHPLGLPIPHTAIIPERKDQIGRSLGEFVEGNFMSREVIGERLRNAGVARRLGDWLAEPANATRASDALSDALNSTLKVLDDREVQAGLEKMVEQRIRSTEVAPLVGQAIDLAIDGGHHERLFDAVLTGVSGFMVDNRETFRARLDQESPWWVPEPIDSRIFTKIYNGVQRFLLDVAANPDHEIRRNVEQRAVAFAERLKSDPALAAKGEELKDELLAHPDMRAWMGSLWKETKQGLLDATATPDSEFRRRMALTLQRLGARLQSEPELQTRVDESIERLVMYVVDNYRSEVSALIESTIAKWDGPSTARLMELQVGRDLQFIRINGTIVGCLAGIAIHTITQFL